MDLPSSKIVYRTRKIEGLDIFYREAGPRDAPVVLLLHGFPSSSFMFRNLIPLLADKYHLVAPDFPGYGFTGRFFEGVHSGFYVPKALFFIKGIKS